MKPHILFTFAALTVILFFTNATAGEAAKVNLESVQTLGLKTAGKMALAGNPSLAAAGARVRQAKERIEQARSRYWPSLDATASVSQVTLSDNEYNSTLASLRAINPAADPEDPEEYYKAGLTASWLLFDGFERKFTNASARYGGKQVESAQKDAKRLILSAVAGSYFSAQLALEEMAIARANEDFNKKQLKDAEVRQRAGTGSLSDALNFRVRMNDAKNQSIAAEQSYEAAMYGLAALMGVPKAQFPAHIKLEKLPKETREELLSPDTNALMEYAKKNRPDIIRNDYSIKQADSDINVARAGNYPKIAVAASLNGSRTKDPAFEPEDFGKTLSLNLSYNIFAGGYHRAKIREAKEKKKEAEKNMEDLKITVFKNIRQSASRLLSAQKQLALQRSNADLVEENRNLVAKEYEAGQGSLVRLNEAQRDLITAQSRLALALASLRSARYSLLTETGEILAQFEE